MEGKAVDKSAHKMGVSPRGQDSGTWDSREFVEPGSRGDKDLWQILPKVGKK